MESGLGAVMARIADPTIATLGLEPASGHGQPRDGGLATAVSTLPESDTLTHEPTALIALDVIVFASD